MNAEGKSRYFKEVARNLQRCGFESEGLNGDGLLPVRWQGQPLCIQEVAGYRLRCVSIYAMLLQRKSPMRIIIHIGRGMFSIPPAMSGGNQVQHHRWPFPICYRFPRTVGLGYVSVLPVGLCAKCPPSLSAYGNRKPPRIQRWSCFLPVRE